MIEDWSLRLNQIRVDRREETRNKERQSNGEEEVLVDEAPNNRK